ncbi:MAG: YebC/PmpR family DNA-binding transcriptional regulator [Anaerolineales bacterium]|jgi:YebC/PmpR family DNA-binding regulatory protein|nr:YebC/PmpR family DNA-binding transcriptional regulator [Anaerolineales bacterium]
MSGHSKWSTIKRKKGAADAKRGAIFTRITRELVLAAREGGGDINANFRLRLAVDKARSENMPKDNIDRAIKRGTGESKDGNDFEEFTYEGYGPHGVALIMEGVTDNRNRTVAELRHLLSKGGGSMAQGGAVAWQFTRNAYFSFPSENLDFDEVFMLAVEVGAEDVTEEEGYIEIRAPVEVFKELSDLLQGAGIQPEEAGLRMFPNNEVELEPDSTIKVMNLIENLEELDDVQSVYSNLRISAEALAQLEAA